MNEKLLSMPREHDDWQSCERCHKPIEPGKEVYWIASLYSNGGRDSEGFPIPFHADCAELEKSEDHSVSTEDVGHWENVTN
jgi:hypothetical protein